MRFQDRHDAGTRLALRLRGEHLTDPIVLALPRGGVPVAFEVAKGLNAPLDVTVTRKIGAPSRPELAVGAIAEGGEPELDRDMLNALRLTPRELAPTIALERAELERRMKHYRGDRQAPEIQGRTVLLIDDGLATGSTARAAVRSLRRRGPRRLVLAVPVCPPETARRLQEEADDVISLLTPPDFRAVGVWYVDFGQTSDAQVMTLLEQARRDARASH
ncbi:MAG: phosphoribosyltransferase [Nitriliruptorales bacterium]|nr:phosphoribosyltransferase [Nitriliruptorales bacterium]